MRTSSFFVILFVHGLFLGVPKIGRVEEARACRNEITNTVAFEFGVQNLL